MLSQQAWKVGRAFTQGRNSAPAEFAEVEREANGLSDALKITAETLHEDDGILSRAEPETKVAVNAILQSARRTLADMESFVERYQVIRKRKTNGGFVVEKSWSDVIMANYKTFKWTTEGGTLTDLRNMLQVHTNTITLTMQALQSRSLARLERAVIPLAESINSIHDRVHGDIGAKINDIHDIVMSIANSTPSLVARNRRLTDNTCPISPIDGNGNMLALEDSYDDLRPPPLRVSSFVPVARVTRPDRTPRDSVQSTPMLSHRHKKSEGRRSSSMIDRAFEDGSPPDARHSLTYRFDGDDEHAAAGASATSASPHTTRETSLFRRESSTLPSIFQTTESDSGAEQHRQGQRPRDATFSTTSEQSAESWLSNNDEPALPPPAIPPGPPQSPATPSSIFSQGPRLRNDSNPWGRRSRGSAATSTKEDPAASPAPSALAMFEKALFRNSAILADVRATSVEYAQVNPDEPDLRYQTEMVDCCKQARICEWRSICQINMYAYSLFRCTGVIRKREQREHGGTRLATSIWTLSEDGGVRCQQKLSEVADTVPFCSYFQTEKVSLAAAELMLRFHGPQWTDMHEKDVKTHWINYIFASERDASAFQSAVFGRKLIGTFHTTKTTVIHEGIKGAFAFEEQFANIEMLRLWEDDGISTPGAPGGVMALMLISSSFGDGWARWWMNSSKQQVRVKDEGGKHAKIKGIDVTVVKPGTGVSIAEKIRNPGVSLQRVDTKESLDAPRVPMKKIPVKRVTGVRVEFKTDADRARFVEITRELQSHMLPLPDL